MKKDKTMWKKGEFTRIIKTFHDSKDNPVLSKGHIYKDVFGIPFREKILIHIPTGLSVFPYLAVSIKQIKEMAEKIYPFQDWTPTDAESVSGLEIYQAVNKIVNDTIISNKQKKEDL